jgi:hypothetical protein
MQQLPPPSRAFKQAGFAFMRSDWKPDATCVVLDASGCNSGHWHAGKPNLLIHKGNQALAAEHVYASYDDPAFWRYFHHAKAHNTVLVDGVGDNTPASPWSMEHETTPALDLFLAGETVDIARARTDGFRRMDPPVDFERTVVFVKPDLVFVHDVLTSAGRHRYEWLMHFTPQELHVDEAAAAITTRTGGPYEMTCRPATGKDARLRGPAIRQGKFARDFAADGRAGKGRSRSKNKDAGLYVPAPYAAWTCRSDGRTVFDFVCQIHRAGEKPVEVEPLSVRGTAGSSTWLIRRGREATRLLFNGDRRRRKTMAVEDGTSLSGSVAVLRRGEALAEGKILQAVK